MSGNVQKLEFTGSQGAMLAAGLEMPSGDPRAYALFAHCFTCSKDLFAVRTIARELTRHGIAVLRFDFTGLGSSGGDFANTGFSSNVQDLIAAADYLRQRHKAPQVLIGHSLGGAAILASAAAIPEARAVVTIGAPADADHVLHHFSASIGDIEQHGHAEVELAGRSFTITRDMLHDIQSSSLNDAISGLKRALLVLHSPLDNIVGIDNATKIFLAAKHPKSFVSLDHADHLLSRRSDAEYAAQVIAAWAGRYISASHEKPEPDLPSGTTRVRETGVGKFQQIMRTGTHQVIADEPEKVGGLDSGPSPYDLLSMALGACTSMTLRMYAGYKKLDLPAITVDVSHERIHAEDCKDCGEGRSGRIDRFERAIHIAGGVDALPAELRDKLIEIAGKCPVHRTLEASSVVATRLVADD